MNRSFRRAGVALTAALAVSVPAVAAATSGGASEERKQFITSAQEDATTDRVTFTVHPSVDDDGEHASYVVTESSDKKDAKRRGVNYSPKLANAIGTAAVQNGWYDRKGVLHVEDTVDFSPNRVVTPSATGFPPLAAAPGAVGQPGHSRPIQLPTGIAINAPAKKNRNYWTNDALPADADAWLAGATEVPGSWWPEWSGWLKPLSGPLVAAAKAPGNRKYPAIEAAPGRYVLQKA